MNHKLSVTVQIDLDGKNVRIVATGCLTESSQRGLLPLIQRAGTLVAGIRVVVDLAGAHHVEAAGVDLLRWAVDLDGPGAGNRRVELVVPDPLPDHLGATAPRGRPAAEHTTGTGRFRRKAA